MSDDPIISLVLKSGANETTKPCDCGTIVGAKCDCACHVPFRDNTNTDDDLELDRLKAQLRSADERGAALVVERDALRGQLDDVNRMLDEACASGAALLVERDTTRAEVGRVRAGQQRLLEQRDAAVRMLDAARAELAQSREALKLADEAIATSLIAMARFKKGGKA